MRNHRRKTHLNAHPQTNSTGGISSHTTHDVRAIPGNSPLEAIFMQDAVADMDPLDLIITPLDVKGAFPNTPHRLLKANVGTNGPSVRGLPTSISSHTLVCDPNRIGYHPMGPPDQRLPHGGAKGPFRFLLVTHPPGFYLRRTYPDVAPGTTFLAFADNMAVATATTRQPLQTTPDATRSTRVMHNITG